MTVFCFGDSAFAEDTGAEVNPQKYSSSKSHGLSLNRLFFEQNRIRADHDTFLLPGGDAVSHSANLSQPAVGSGSPICAVAQAEALRDSYPGKSR